MKLSSAAVSLFVSIAGSQIVAAQAQQTTTQFDLWNWYAAKAPVDAQGIWIDPASDQTWYMASNSGFYITRDAGATWTQILSGAVSKEAVAIDPVKTDLIYVGAGSSIYVSTDHGITWNKGADFPQPIASVFVSPSDESVFAGPHAATGFSGIYRSQDHGSTWTPLPYGGAFSAINSTTVIAEDGSGWLWVATQASPTASGKNMLLHSGDRGTTWADNSAGLTAPPTKIFWDTNGAALYLATNTGVVGTGNQGVLWKTFTFANPVLTLTIPQPNGSAFGVGLLVGLDTGAGGGAGIAGTLSHTDMIDPHVSTTNHVTDIGLQGVPIQSVSVNHASTKFLVVGTDGGIYGGTLMQPSLNPNVVNVTPGGALLIGCQTCPFGPGMQISINGQLDTLVPNGPAASYSYAPQRWDVPANMPFGTYPAQLITTFPPISFTVVVGNAPSKSPTITSMESVRFAVKPQYGLGEVVSVFGTSLTGAVGSGSAANFSSGLPLATQLAQCQVLVDGSPVPLYYAYTGSDGSSQINFQIPYSLVPGTHQLQVNRLLASGALDASTSSFPFTVAAASPTYIADASGTVYVQDNSQGPDGSVFAGANTPARSLDVATIYATGLGATSPAVQAGSVPPPGTLASVQAPVSISLWDGVVTQWNANVLGAVASPQFPGLYQIAFQFPAGVKPIGSTIKLIIGVGADTQTFTIYFTP